MSSNVVVKLENVSKFYKLYNNPKERLKEALNPFGKKYHKEFYALQDINLELKRGECLGVIGRNGMGKSTLLKLIAHIIEPSSGNIFVNGTVSALLELGTGFNPEFTGLQNIYFYGTILGFNKKQVEQKTEEIISFADIGEFINQPVKTYSSGMFVRLAFAVQTSLTPDILLVDEVLSVGDIFFQQKCHARIEELLLKGTALILVSHDMQMIAKYSSSTLFLDYGRQAFYGGSNMAIQTYYHSFENKPLDSVSLIKDSKNNFDKHDADMIISESSICWPDKLSFSKFDNMEIIGDTSIAIVNGIAITSSDGYNKSIFRIGETIRIYYEFLLLKDIEIPIGGIEIRNVMNIFIHGKNTLQYDSNKNSVVKITKAGSLIRFIQQIRLTIAPDDYILTVGLASISYLDYKKYVEKEKLSSEYIKMVLRVPQASYFSVSSEQAQAVRFYGITDLEGKYHSQILTKENSGI